MRHGVDVAGDVVHIKYQQHNMNISCLSGHCFSHRQNDFILFNINLSNCVDNIVIFLIQT